MTPANILEIFHVLVSLGCIASVAVVGLSYLKSGVEQSASVPYFSMQVFMTVLTVLLATQFSRQQGATAMFFTVALSLGVFAGIFWLIATYSKNCRKPDLASEAGPAALQGREGVQPSDF